VTVYFAYGANMDPVHMAEQCPGAARLGPAILRDHAFGIAAGHYATVRRRAGSAVYGVLWQLTPADEAALDEFEGVATGFYRKDTLPVEQADRTVVDAMLYRPIDDAPGTASRRYLERILEVAAMLELPPSYQAELASFRPGGPPP
jgi:hypothetical protein